MINDRDREDWVMNDEALYSWWTRSGKPVRRFVRDERATLTEYIERRLGEGP